MSDDPLARLLADGGWSGSVDRRPPVSAAAGRLTEVEASIARDMVERRLGLGETTSARAPVAPDRRAPTANRAPERTATVEVAAANGEEAVPARPTSAPSAPAVPSVPGLPLSTPPIPSGSALAESLVPATTSAGPAADLVSDADAPPEAVRLAARGASVLAGSRGGSIVMRLEPPALGPLRIEIQIARGAVEADFTATTLEARALLETNAGVLRERLESQGLAVERLSIHGSRAGDGASTASQGGDGREARQEGGERPRQDAAGGESRGRRDGERGHERGASRDAGRDGGGSFAGILGRDPRIGAAASGEVGSR